MCAKTCRGRGRPRQATAGGVGCNCRAIALSSSGARAWISTPTRPAPDRGSCEFLRLPRRVVGQYRRGDHQARRQRRSCHLRVRRRHRALCAERTGQIRRRAQPCAPCRGRGAQFAGRGRNPIEDHQSVIYRNGAADFQMTERRCGSGRLQRYSDALITDGHCFAPTRRAARLPCVRTGAAAAGVPLIFDIDYRPYSWPSPRSPLTSIPAPGPCAT